VNRKVYREVATHLRNENDEGSWNSFHLKNKGITILADKVTRGTEENVYELNFSSDSQGIVDGGHTYKIICENKDFIRQRNQDVPESAEGADGDAGPAPIAQYVKIEVLTGLSSDLTTEIARGLNTAVQVREQSLANHAGKFKWIKSELGSEPYFGDIAFRENENGLYDATDLLCVLELFNIFDYPNDGSSKHPLRAYTGRENVLKSFIRGGRGQRPALERLRPILKDVLCLHDTISSQARDLWNAQGGKRKGGRLAFVDAATKADFVFPFLGSTGRYRLYKGALFPILASFRWMVVEDSSNGTVKWRNGFEEVLGIWNSLAIKLLEATRETSDELGRKADVVGKSSNHWKNLYNLVAFHQAVTLSQANQ
jgi:hypothetical protein